MSWLMRSTLGVTLMQPSYKVEHPDYDDDLTPYFTSLNVPQEPTEAQHVWVDCSWHNNTCPCVCYKRNDEDHDDLTLWFDYKDPNNGEYSEARAANEMHRFALYEDFNNKLLLSTDSWEEMFAYINNLLKE
jgi:hypothetical protein